MDGDDVGDLRIGTVVVNVQDMDRAVAFWEAALGYERRERPSEPDFVMVRDPAGGGLPVFLQLTDRPAAAPARVHLDLYTADQERQVARLVALGASRVEDWGYPDDPEFVVLRDPDGNEFCVVEQTDP